MNNYRRKAFTIVELVIVMAIISILASVLLPTFSTVIREAKDSYILQNDKNKLLNEYIESTLDEENYIPPKNESESIPENRIDELKTDLGDLLNKVSQSIETSGWGCGFTLYKSLRDDKNYTLISHSAGGAYSRYWFSYDEKYNIYFDAVGDLFDSIQIRFYDDINTSSGESVYYGLKANKKGDETDENGNPKYEIEVIKYVEPQN